MKLPEVLKATERKPKAEQIKAVAKLYLPVAGVGAVTLAALAGSNSISMKQRSAMMTALGLMRDKESDMHELPNLGMAPPENVLSGDGDILYYENYTGRWFMSDSDIIKDAQKILNDLISDKGYASLNDFYQLIGVKSTEFGEEVGWCGFDRHVDGYILLAETIAVTADGVSCRILDFYQNPYFCYMDLP